MLIHWLTLFTGSRKASDANFVIDHLSAKQMENGFDRVERANVARDVDSDFRIISKPLGVRHFEEVPTATNGRRLVCCSLGLVSMAYSLYVTTEPIFASSKPEFTFALGHFHVG